MTSLRGWLQARGGCCGETGGLSPTGSAPKGVAAQPSVLVALEPTRPSALSPQQPAECRAGWSTVRPLCRRLWPSGLCSCCPSVLSWSCLVGRSGCRASCPLLSAGKSRAQSLT